MNVARALRNAVTASLLAALVPLPLHAAEDAGTTSAFTDGAGVRALGLGGAYAATADDAAGWLWNPGGLGWAERPGVELGQLMGGALGISEFNACVVVPSWRWGTVSSAYRTYGVGGLVGRDARNAIVATDFSVRESEFALGYGRAVSEAWALGAVAKLRRQEVAGISGTAGGADLGVTLKPARLAGARFGWAEGLRLGLGLRNVLQPVMRLEADQVPDPRGVLAGVALERPLFGLASTLTALDLDFTGGRSVRARAGLELRLSPAADLRLGLHNANLTAGAGLRVRGIAVEYAFEDGPFASSQRLAVSTPFGRSVRERRAADMLAEEQAIQRRLASAFDERDRLRVRELLDQADRARRDGDCDRALELATLVRSLDPDNTPAATLEANCLRERALASERAGSPSEAAVLFERVLKIVPTDSAAAEGLSRARQAGLEQSQRSAEHRARFSRGIGALAADSLKAAREAFAGIVENQPSDAEARAMLNRVERAIAQRVELEVGEGMRMLAAGLRDEARRSLEAARALDPSSPRVASLNRTLGEEAAAANAGVSTSPAPPPPAPEPSVQDLAEAAAMYKRGLTAFERGAADEAIRYLELVRVRQPGHAGAASLLKRLYQTRGMDAFAAGRLEQAVGLWEQALSVDPTDERTRAYLARAQEHLARTQALRER